MQMTLLQLTQDILSHMTSDEVNSISDTTESMQVATIIKNKYYDIIGRYDLTKHDQLFQLTASDDASAPVLMYVPDGVARIDSLKYFDSNVNDSEGVSQFGSHDINLDITSTVAWSTTSTTSNTISTGAKTFTVGAGLTAVAGNNFIATSGASELLGTVTSYSGTTLVVNVTSAIGSGTYTTWVINQNSSAQAPPGYRYVTILPIQQFIDMVNKFNPTDTNVQSFSFNNSTNGFGNDFTFYYKNDIQPRFCTVISNYYVIFDSYDNTQDSTLQGSKTMTFGQVMPTFTMADSFIPNLDEEQFPLLLNEAKALAFFELKQMVHSKAEQEIKRQWSAVQKNKSIDNKPSYFDQLPDFGWRKR